MLSACDMIRLAGEDELNDIFIAVIQQYSLVNPDWEMGVYVLQKSKDRAAQIDQIIAFLEGVKKYRHHRKREGSTTLLLLFSIPSGSGTGAPGF